MSRVPLRLGLLLDARAMPAWVDSVLAGIADGRVAEPCLVMVVRHAPPRQSWIRRLRDLPFRLYEQVDRAVFGTPPDPLALVDASSRLPGAARCETQAVRQGKELSLDGPAIAALRSADLDVILALGAQPIGGEVAEAARFGIWSFRHGGAGPAAPVLFWEVFHRLPLAVSGLEARTANSAPRWLRCSWSRADPTSLERTRSPVYWKTAHFALRALRELHESGKVHLDAPQPQAEPLVERGMPGPTAMLGFAWSLLWVYLANRVRARIGNKLWHVGLRRARSFDPRHFDASGFDLVAAPRGRFFADPFLLQRDGRTYLFVEDGDARIDRAVIAVCEIEDGRVGVPTVVLSRPYHLSYPHVFEFRGEVFMLPETSVNRTIELYKAVDFPRHWELERVLFENVDAVDPTLIEHAGRFWLFANMKVKGGSYDDELFLFFADSPLGPWHPHPRNPIVSDVRHARPAGRAFVHEGALLRPAQDCSPEYGRAIRLMRVEVLSETDYREVEVGAVEPVFGRAVAVHTLARTSDLEAIDWRAFVPRWRA